MSNVDLKEVEAYLKSDRQWTREQRLQHAQYRCKSAVDTSIDFWEAVIKRLSLTE